MLVYLNQYKREEVDMDDNRTTGESQTEESVDPDPEEYFGEDLDLGATWETAEYDGDPVQRREIEIDGVTAVSIPDRPEGPDADLPGSTIQVRKEGAVEQFDHAVLVEAEDPDPE